VGWSERKKPSQKGVEEEKGEVYASQEKHHYLTILPRTHPVRLMYSLPLSPDSHQIGLESVPGIKFLKISQMVLMYSEV